MRFAVYDTATGKIKRRMTGLPCDHVDIQCGDNEEFFLNCPADATHILNNQPVALPPPQISREAAMWKVRMDRNMRLSATDWTQVSDAPVDKAAWAKYRQALRDFPATCDPYNPVWPTPPTK